MTIFKVYSHLYHQFNCWLCFTNVFFLLKEGKDGSRGKIIHLFYQYFLGDVLGQAVGKQSLRFVCSSIGEHFQD